MKTNQPRAKHLIALYSLTVIYLIVTGIYYLLSRSWSLETAIVGGTLVLLTLFLIAKDSRKKNEFIHKRDSKHLTERDRLIYHLEQRKNEDITLIIVEFNSILISSNYEFIKSINKITIEMVKNSIDGTPISIFILHDTTIAITFKPNKSNNQNTEHKIIKSIESIKKQKGIYATIRAGIAHFPENGNGEKLVHAAELALRQSKIREKVYTRYTTSTNALLSRKNQLISEIQKAIEKNELTLHYQPQIDLNSNEVTGAEALVRWEHDTLGQIGPAEILNSASTADVLHELENWVIDEACRQINQWDQGHMNNIKVSINLTGWHIQRPELIKTLEESLNKYQIKPQKICIEITETTPVELSKETELILSYLSLLGIEVHLDDFGTGHFSFDNLAKLPASTIKLDKSLIKNLETIEKQRSLAQDLIRMAHRIGLKVIAEGVESKDQVDILKKIGCNYGQGFFWSPPCPPNQFEIFLKMHALEASGKLEKKIISDDEMKALSSIFNRPYIDS